MKATQERHSKVSVDIDQLMNVFAMDRENFFIYVATMTGEVVVISQDELSAAENEDPLDIHPEWSRDSIKLAQRVLQFPDEYVPFSKWDVEETFRVMETFCCDIDDIDIRQDMLNLLGGRGTFRRFRDAVYRHHLGEQWYRFEKAQQRQYVRDWCEINNFAILETK